MTLHVPLTLAQFGQIIGRRVTAQRVRDGTRVFWRCHFPDTVYADTPHRAAAIVTIIGCGPNPERARADLAQKICGKHIRVFDGMGAYTEYAIPHALTP